MAVAQSLHLIIIVMVIIMAVSCGELADVCLCNAPISKEILF